MTATFAEPTTERDAFLRATAAEPEDDTPRLVFADWLDEQDNRADRARAAFIRASLEIHHGAVPTCSRVTGENVTRVGLVSPVKRCRCPWCKIARRSWMASRSFAGEWKDEALAPIESERTRQVGQAVRDGSDLRALFATHSPVDVLFRRGFVERLSVPKDLFVRHAGALFGLSPITEVALFDETPAFRPVPALLSGRQSGQGEHAWVLEYGPPAFRRVLYMMPQVVFDLLPGEVVQRDERLMKIYPHSTKATAALQTALLAYGRRKRDRLWANAVPGAVAS